MIELNGVPFFGGMAALAARTQAPFMNILRLMAANARRR